MTENYENGYTEGLRDGAARIKVDIIEAVKQAHAKDTAGDQCERENACAECDLYYHILDVIEAVQ
jgi:hypothetical protein